MKKIQIAICCLLTMAAISYGQTTQSITFSDNGLYGGTNTSGTFNANDTFSLDTNITFSGFTGIGLSYWIEVPAALAPFITITSRQYFTWTDPTTGAGTIVFASSNGADSGFLGENSDLGATSQTDINNNFVEAKGAGTYKVSTLGFTLNGAPAGTYTLQLEVLSPHRSEINDDAFVSHFVGVSTYTITIVPEPATWSLLGLGGLGAVAVTSLRARRRS